MKYIAAFILILLTSPLLAKVSVKAVEVTCSGSESCKLWESKIAGMKGSYRDEEHVSHYLKVLASEGGFSLFTYEFDELQKKLHVSLRFKPLVSDVIIDSSIPELVTIVEQSLQIKQGDFLSEDIVEKEKKRIASLLSQKGYSKTQIDVTSQKSENSVVISLKIKVLEVQKLKEIIIKSQSQTIKRFAKLKLERFRLKKFDSQEFRQELEELERELQDYGFYLVSSNLSLSRMRGDITATLSFSNPTLFGFSLKENGKDQKIVFKTMIRDFFKKYKREVDNTLLINLIREYYEKMAFRSVKIDIRKINTKNTYEDHVINYLIRVEAKKRLKLGSINFQGNTVFSNKELLEIFKKDASELIDGDLFDKDYINSFKDKINYKYAKKGYVSSLVTDPILDYRDLDSRTDITYKITEGVQSVIDEFEIEGVSQAVKKKLLEISSNKINQAIDPFALEDDLKKMVKYLNQLGYYKAAIVRSSESKIVSYSKSRNSVSIKVKFNTGKIYTFGRFIITGLNKTKRYIVSRKIVFKTGEILTPDKVKEIESSVSSLGLFNSIVVRPVESLSNTSATDVKIALTEKDYGAIEIAPGYRTDIGLKLSSQVSYSNLGGTNQSILVKGQVNRRTSLRALDPIRREQNKSLIEYNATAQYNKNDIFLSYIDYSVASSFQRKRFYSFDADIQRLNNTFSKQLTKSMTVSIRHQYEAINQFEAVEQRDNGSFVIGAITPNIVYDLRNNRVNPTSGAFFNLSTEFANPTFLSQNEEDLKIDFYKLVSRNIFYVPLPRGVLALSIAGGIQENLATKKIKDDSGNPIEVDGKQQSEGYIPSIKVFRLTGTDIVRGFSDEEINRLVDGSDIGDKRIQTRAYMTNIKIEPRYFINDTFITGVFFDAGRVFVDDWDLGELRQSAGITFKILTPVGTLDFDYGIKLLRKRNTDGSLESPGRFHVSIGFF